MKALLMAVMLISVTAKAQVISATAVGLGTSGITYAVGFDHNQMKKEPLKLKMLYSTGAPFILTMLWVLKDALQHKEELAELKKDASNFLAGFEKTELLEDLIQALRSSSKDFDGVSDEEIAAAFVHINQ